MKKVLICLTLVAGIAFTLPSCAGSESGSADQEGTSAESTSQPAQGSAPSPRADTTKVTIDDHGASIESGKTSVKVGQEGASVETKDVQVSVGDTDKNNKKK